MTLLLKHFFTFLKLLNSDTDTHPLAFGIVLGMLMGFSPALSLQTLLALVILFFFRVQIGAAIASAFFFAIPAYLLDPLFHLIGTRVLEMQALEPLFTTLYHLPLVPLTRFNNTVVMGAGVTAICLALPVFLVSKKLIIAYRARIVARFKGTRFWKAVQASTFYKWYATYESFHG